jgi:phage terminase Nu1 subunit (DNA packaging protein)
MAAKVPTVSLETLANLIDLTPRRVNQLADEGIIPRTKRGVYELAPAVRGYVHFLREFARGRDKTEARNKARLTGTRAEIEELKRARLAGEMIPREQVIRIWAEPAMAMRSHLLGIPSKVAARVGMCKSTIEVQALLRREIEDALSELAKINIVIEAPGADAAGDDASRIDEDTDDDLPDDGAAASSIN